MSQIFAFDHYNDAIFHLNESLGFWRFFNGLGKQKFEIHHVFFLYFLRRYLQVESLEMFCSEAPSSVETLPYHHTVKTPPNQGAAALRHKNRELYVCVAAVDDELLIAFLSSLFHHCGFITLVNGCVHPTWVSVQSNSTVNTNRPQSAPGFECHPLMGWAENISESDVSAFPFERRSGQIGGPRRGEWNHMKGLRGHRINSREKAWLTPPSKETPASSAFPKSPSSFVKYA